MNWEQRQRPNLRTALTINPALSMPSAHDASTDAKHQLREIKPCGW